MVKKVDHLGYLRTKRKSIRFPILVSLLKKLGWKLKTVRGSHFTFAKVASLPIVIVKPHGGHKYCHPSDVDKVIKILESGIAND